MSEFKISDGTRSVTAPGEVLARKALAVCEANNINDNTGRDAFLNAMTTAQEKAALIALFQGLVDVGPP